MTILAPNLLHPPAHKAVVAEGTAKPQKKADAGAPAKGPDFVEKAPLALPPPEPASPLSPPPVAEAVPAQAEEGAHQSASITAPPFDETPQQSEVASVPTPSGKEPALPQWLENSVAARDPGNRPMISIVLDDVGVAPQHAGRVRPPAPQKEVAAANQGADGIRRAVRGGPHRRQRRVLVPNGLYWLQSRHYSSKKEQSHLTGDKQLAEDQRALNQQISHYRILVENVNSSLKNWKIISSVFRGDLENHHKIFTCCCILTNMETDESIY